MDKFNDEKYEASEHSICLEDSHEKEPINRKFLYIAVATANLTAFSCGECFGWSSPVLPKLSSNETCINPLGEPISISEGSWIGSLLPVGAIIGPFIAGNLMDKIGSKKTLLISIIPMILGFFLSAYAHNVWLFYVARFIQGLAVGAICTIMPSYVAEISDDEVRGAMSTMMQLFIVLGILFSFCVGPYVSIYNFNLFCSLAPLTFLFAFYLYIPESPYFYIAKNNLGEAEKSLQKFRSRQDVGVELNHIKMNVEESLQNKGKASDLYKSPGLRKGITLSAGLMALQQFSGINVILFYTQTIFGKTGSTMPAEVASIVIGLVQVGGSLLTPILVDRTGKRLLLLVSAAFMALSEGILGAYFQCNWTLSWLPITCLISYIIAYCLGFGPLPWAVLGEIFPSNVKSVASTFTSAWCWFLSFILTKYFSTVSELIGIGGSFYIFAGCCAFGVFFVFKFLPDTRGMSLDEIQKLIIGKSS